MVRQGDRTGGRRASRATAVVLVGLALASGAGPVAASVPDLRCDPGDRTCDMDGDRIPDAVEQVVCGSATCATGAEDADGDGVPDWTEYLASGSTTGVDPAADRDSDGMPDYAERLTCGTDTCATGREDVDGDGVRDWAEVVICGDTTCATGDEDLDGDGVPDHQQLQACVVYDRGTWWDRASRLATTGSGPWLLAACALALLGGGGWLLRRSRRARAARRGTAVVAVGDPAVER
jgi:hypothetical protein